MVVDVDSQCAETGDRLHLTPVTSASLNLSIRVQKCTPKPNARRWKPWAHLAAIWSQFKHPNLKNSETRLAIFGIWRWAADPSLWTWLMSVMWMPDLDSRLAYPRPRPRPRLAHPIPRPRPRPRLKTYKTNTGSLWLGWTVTNKKSWQAENPA